MTNLRQILTDWTTASGSGKVTVMYFLAAESVVDQRAAIHDLFNDMGVGLDDSCSFTVRTSGVEIDDETGTLIGSWSEPTAQTGTGDGSGQPVADAIQVLLQWQTPAIVGGRFLKGRTFVPGLGNGNEAGGNLAPTAQTTFQGIVDTFVDSDVGFGVWHRPAAGSGGSFDQVISGTVWSELAVLRRRRG